MTYLATARRPSAELESAENGRERRIHRRVTPGEMNAHASLIIQNRPPVSLVDLSTGGARIDLPFQMKPDTCVTVELRSASERLLLPFRLLRCYVTSLKGGVVYQAAGIFEKQLDRNPLLSADATQATSNALITSLESFLARIPGRDMESDFLLMSILEAARRGERPESIATEIRSRLTRLLPSLVIEPPTQPFLADPARAARFFGLDFKNEDVLTTPHRRLLRTAAQLLSILDSNSETEGVMQARLLNFNPRMRSRH